MVPLLSITDDCNRSRCHRKKKKLTWTLYQPFKTQKLEIYSDIILNGSVSLKILTFAHSKIWSPDRVGSTLRTQGWHQSAALWRRSRGSLDAQCFHSSSWTDATGKSLSERIGDEKHSWLTSTTWPHYALTVKLICSGLRVFPLMSHTITCTPFLRVVVLSQSNSSANKVSLFCCFLMRNTHVESIVLDLNRKDRRVTVQFRPYTFLAQLVAVSVN